jgi:hypothetical protein
LRQPPPEFENRVADDRQRCANGEEFVVLANRIRAFCACQGAFETLPLFGRTRGEGCPRRCDRRGTLARGCIVGSRRIEVTQDLVPYEI